MFYSEGIGDFKIALKKIADIKKRYFETTLLDRLHLPDRCTYENLPTAITARIAPYDHLRCIHIPIKKLDFLPLAKEGGSDGWEDFNYNHKGEAKESFRLFELPTRSGDSESKEDVSIVEPTTPQPNTARMAKAASIKLWQESIPQVKNLQMELFPQDPNISSKLSIGMQYL